ncbi:MAG: bifunctional phosphoribosyl-AMP cyclohydrolase/phosphoribosyl-ATP diphosphatase HisIE [Proteobacteria bacterium]|nr:bifunctional phosphoribosyl-AMP cyclohydrolase/phosphoribosyl-ATP diphosphatase HisIE [Pseudomonadota bacterium]
MTREDVDKQPNSEWIQNLDFQKGDGLIPCVIQHDQLGIILMLGYMNQESLQKTIDEGWVCFYSRSQQKNWQKGEVSGHKLKFISCVTDCDHDALVVRAIPLGPTCHLGKESCFFRGFKSHHQWSNDGLFSLLFRLEDLIKSRLTELETESPVAIDTGKTSYTKSLMAKGLLATVQKLGEESVETVIAATSESGDRLTKEVADLMYHLMVVLAMKEISWSEVLTELDHRHQAPTHR